MGLENMKKRLKKTIYNTKLNPGDLRIAIANGTIDWVDFDALFEY